QVLTHLVEGFVIQEGLQPFPSKIFLGFVSFIFLYSINYYVFAEYLIFCWTQDKQMFSSGETERNRAHPGRVCCVPSESGHKDRTVLHCQFCGKRGHAHNFMRSKRFCSTSCARGFNVRLTKRLRALSAGSRSERPRPALNRAESVPGKPLLLRLFSNSSLSGLLSPRSPGTFGAPGAARKTGRRSRRRRSAEDDDDDGGEEDPAVAMAARMERRAARRARRASAPAVTASTPTTTFRPAPAQWSVEEVTAFIHTLPGCGDVAEAFRLQEIDGQALLLLTEDHLMTSMNIKLGPALKICAHINALKNQ
uniref:Polyhomeotic homolog 3 n=1 Tax=Poecilia formosa TaxID=48698 RepID=A0A096LYC6_POEFO